MTEHQADELTRVDDYNPPDDIISAVTLKIGCMHWIVFVLII